MQPTPQRVQNTYLVLTLLSTLAASMIWGINTLFLLNAGLSNAAAFGANAFFTAGQVLFEVPTGVVADVRGRRTSYALGVLTLMLTTIVYYEFWLIHGPFWAWALDSVLLGLGFTFFSGATEAWLVDALKASGYQRKLESVFAQGQAVTGGAMLVGSVGGGLLAQATNLGVPYLVRADILLLTLIVCLATMRDWGLTPKHGETPLQQIKLVLRASNEHGWRNPKVRWLMLSSPFLASVGFYIFYAAQPYLLQLYGNPSAYSIAGLMAAIMAGAQIVGSVLSPRVQGWFRSSPQMLLVTATVSIGLIALLGLTNGFALAVGLLVIWGVVGALSQPVRQAYLNNQIQSSERATVLSFDSLMSSAGGVVTQPVLGRVADASGYAASFLVGAFIQLGAIPFL